MLLLSVPMSWICFRKAVLKPLCVGKARYSNKEKFGILEENLRPPPSSSESWSSPILAIEVAPKSFMGLIYWIKTAKRLYYNLKSIFRFFGYKVVAALHQQYVWSWTEGSNSNNVNIFIFVPCNKNNKDYDNPIPETEQKLDIQEQVDKNNSTFNPMSVRQFIRQNINTISKPNVRQTKKIFDLTMCKNISI